MSRLKTVVLLNVLMMVYSLSGVLSKLAAGENFMSAGFCLKYAGIIFLLGIYAIGWQQIIKYLPLTTAYANKAVTIVWGIVWGFIFFHEHLSYGKIIGALIIIIGIVMFVYSDVNSKRGADKP